MTYEPNFETSRFSAGSTGPSGPPEETLSLLSLWRILWARKWFIGALTLAGMVLGLVTTSGGERTYTTETLLILEETDAALASYFSNEGSQYVNPAEAVAVFGSRRLFERVVQGLDLVNDPEFNPFLAAQDAAPSPVARFVFALRGLFFPGEDDGQAGAATALDVTGVAARQATVDVVQDQVRFLADNSGSLIRVVAVTPDPDLSAKLSDTVAEVFLNEIIEMRLDTLDRVVEQLSLRVTSLRQDVQDKEAALQNFLNRSDSLDSVELAALGDEAQRLRTRLADLEREIDTNSALLSEVSLFQGQGLTDQEILASIAANRALSELFESVALSTESNAPSGVADEIEERFSVRVRLAEGLRESLSNLEMQLAASSEQQVRLQQLRREAEATSEIYNFSVRRLNELLVQGGVEAGGGRIVLRGSPPQLPDGRGRARMMATVGVLGLVTAVGWVLLREATNQTLCTRIDIQRIVPGIRTVPVPRAPVNRFFNRNGRAKQLLISQDSTEYSEGIRRLRGAVSALARDGGKICVQFTSDYVTSGRSLMVLGLARSYVLLGKSVLVIGADMRDSSLTRQLGVVAPKVGLQQVLMSQVRLEEAISRHHELGVMLMLPAKFQGNPADILEGEAFKEMLTAAKNEFDVVIVDTPPLLVAPEAQTLSELVDSVIVVAGGGASTSESLLAALEQLPSPFGASNLVALYGAETHNEQRGRIDRRKFARL
ncbi:Tyrosine-protein kinase YwqD (plasmid) [Sulfitobacter indolifex]|uniref:Chain length determinant domain protein n=1 Tax=Sulfitobacter indolifex HEL-45 TaxID=391624 RepID=A0ABP2D5M5_9RHOB|nr:Wzz/FepE/Etk N-terminal domain-containing protein [Sulfitobacter indolifex]EDQ03418.1 chain length determinant domain protein [Sulfitobacter indolifex HEL-45]UOA21237.1 Tyrosine-protein kinase YwqD [Sulfitobacter indolifex]